MQTNIKDFPVLYPELNWYAGDAVTVHGVGKGAGLQERKRVLSSLANFNHVLNNDYDSFVSGQLIPVNRNEPNGAQQLRPGGLTRESFDSLRHFVMMYITSNEFIVTMEIIIVIHDVTKSLAVIETLRQMGITAEDPDKLLGKVLSVNPNFFPSVARLQDTYKRLVIAILSPGINALQFVQGECLLDEVVEIRKYASTLGVYASFFIIFETFDLAGAAGNAPVALPSKLAEASAPESEGDRIIYVKGSITFDEPTSKNYFTAWQIINNYKSPKDIYDHYMNFRADIIQLPPLQRKIRFALARVASMGRLTSPNDGAILLQAFDSISCNNKIILIAELSDVVYSTMIYYSPQLVVDRIAPPTDRQEGLVAAMVLLADIFTELDRLRREDVKVPRVVNVARYVTFLKARDNPNNPERSAQYQLELVNDFLEPRVTQGSPCVK